MSTSNGILSRREFITTIGSVAVTLCLADKAVPRIATDMSTDEFLLYVGTYTSGDSKSRGIYTYRFNKNNGDLVLNNILEHRVDPSFLIMDKKAKYLFAVNETAEYKGRQSGSVSSFGIDNRGGNLELLSTQPSLGGAPCHITISNDGRFILIANYLGGNVAVLPVKDSGMIGDPIQSIQHVGSGANKDRQGSAHAHSINLDRNNRFAVACDLGADKLFIYEFDRSTGHLSTNQVQPFFKAQPGSGPRHFAFHPNGKAAFVINELMSSVTSFAYDENAGRLVELQTISSLPRDWSGPNTCADIHISTNGKFVYGSNRGHNSIVCYTYDEKLRRLELVDHFATLGKTPRNFTIDPTGRFLLVANKDTDSIVVFKIDEFSGKLTPSGQSVEIPSPVCLRFVQV